MQQKEPEILDENGRPLPKKPSFTDKIALASSRARKIVLLLSGGLAVVIAIITNLDTIIARFTPLKDPDARFTVLENAKATIDEKVWIDPLAVTYELKEEPKKLELKPVSLALNGYYFNNLIPSFSARSYFNVEFPVVDFLVSNPSGSVIEIEELRVEVDQSSPDYSPLFLAWPMCNKGLLQVHIINEGWGPAFNANVSLSIHAKAKSDSLLTIQRSYEQIANGVLIDISTEVEKIVNCSKSPIWIGGTVEYLLADKDDARSRSLSFKPTEALRWPRVGGGPSPVTGEYDFVLEFEKSSYVLRKSVSHRLNPGESDHLLIRFAAPVTSRHLFRIFAKLSDGRTIESKTIDTVVFLPRANAIRLQKGSNTIGSVSSEYFLDEPPIGLTNKDR
ncbi:hypothetical protein [uncultured Desulfuromonas sp.]|uniref:hypothetical protein n=1 Tax=uncultured Desulfuromonas sp. TaxID=181013 RepID=UPI002AAABB8A|nr:hypothetical protein [uncultured Desulfuromonas sp.]